MAENLPHESYLVLPPSLKNRRWLACYSQLRGITYRRGTYRRFAGARWSPLNARSFVPLSAEELRRVLDEDTAVVSVQPENEIVRLANEQLGQAKYHWRTITAKENAAHPTIYRLVRAEP